jgi:hypothetical protein
MMEIGYRTVQLGLLQFEGKYGRVTCVLPDVESELCIITLIAKESKPTDLAKNKLQCCLMGLFSVLNSTVVHLRMLPQPHT